VVHLNSQNVKLQLLRTCSFTDGVRKLREQFVFN
ncbi:30S ribosomal protein S9, partial [Staphylococcus epidermidis]